MKQSDFMKAVAAELRLRGVPFQSRQLREFVQSVWPWAWDNPCPARWATEAANQLAEATQ